MAHLSNGFWPTQHLPVSEKERSIPPVFPEKVLHLLQLLTIFAQLLREPGPFGQGHLPQSLCTCSKVPTFILLSFSSPPLHMGRATALQTCDWKDYRGGRHFIAQIPRESGPSLPSGNPSSLCVSVPYLYSGDNGATPSHRDFVNKNL